MTYVSPGLRWGVVEGTTFNKQKKYLSFKNLWGPFSNSNDYELTINQNLHKMLKDL